MKLKNTLFRNSDLREANFAQSNLAAAIFENCNLERVLFQKTNLEKANLLTSYGYTLDPEDNKIQGAKFSLE
jgi:fluoroquinolone resistance protein